MRYVKLTWNPGSYETLLTFTCRSNIPGWRLNSAFRYYDRYGPGHRLAGDLNRSHPHPEFPHVVAFLVNDEKPTPGKLTVGEVVTMMCLVADTMGESVCANVNKFPVSEPFFIPLKDPSHLLTCYLFFSLTRWF